VNRPRLARDVMVTDLIVLRPEMHVLDGIAHLLRFDISGAPVVDEQWNYRGVFSEKCCMSVLTLTAQLSAQTDDAPPPPVIRAGDFICSPADPAQPHQIVNTSDAILTYIALSTNDHTDVMLYPDSDKYGVWHGKTRDPSDPDAGLHEVFDDRRCDVRVVEEHPDPAFVGLGPADAGEAGEIADQRGAALDGDLHRVLRPVATDQLGGLARHEVGAVVEHHDVIGQPLCLHEVMGAHHDRVPIARHLADQGEHRLGRLGVEARGRLVEEEQLRLVEYGAGQGEAGLHAGGVAADLGIERVLDPDRAAQATMRSSMMRRATPCSSAA